MFLSYRKQSVDLQSKSTDWFLYMGTLVVRRLKQTHLFFAPFLEYLKLALDDNLDEESEYFSNSKSSALGSCLDFAWFFANFNLAFLIKVLLIKKRVFKILIYCLLWNAIFRLPFSAFFGNKSSYSTVCQKKYMPSHCLEILPWFSENCEDDLLNAHQNHTSLRKKTLVNIL